MVRRIVSGGQTGVDRAALNAAMELGIPCGGWCPRGRRAEDGAIPRKYPLQETESRNYHKRTKLNVRDSDATLILNRGELEGGTAYTVRLAEKMGKPYLIVALDGPRDSEPVVAWLDEKGIQVLNVAGPKESKRPGIYDQSLRFLRTVLQDRRENESLKTWAN
jgi:predicted Rossmann-fold nucleotide-binding protein